MTHEQYVRKEQMISIAINGALSLVFFLIVFGQASVIPLWGVGNWVFDFLLQSFMIALMGTLVSGMLTMRRLRAGTLQPAPWQSRLPSSLVGRALVLSVAAALLGTAAITAAVWASGLAELSWTPALVLKVLYGLILAAIVTPIGLRSALARP